MPCARAPDPLLYTLLLVCDRFKARATIAAEQHIITAAAPANTCTHTQLYLPYVMAAFIAVAYMMVCGGASTLAAAPQKSDRRYMQASKTLKHGPS